MASHVIHYTARCSNYYLNSFFEGSYLAVNGLSSIYRKDLYIFFVFQEFSKFLAYLYGQFPCGAEYERLKRLFIRIKHFQTWKPKGCCFSGSCLRLTNYIVSIHNGGDSLGLYWGSFLKTHVFNGTDYFLRQVHFFKF
ncbi:hypothetical protein IMSAG049_01499 [Clostridiales bacterium]|nr:hypothetical protein IMSAG049_01499 [Clostridiales bacterium]